jgi:lactate dehydrogenase-like 2-hydroxyacid dehydrogenase
MTTVLCGVSQCVERIRGEFPDLDVVDLATFDGPVPPDAILFSGFDQKSVDAANAGVAWIQLAGTGIDHVNPALLQAPIVTCAKGAGAIPIAEYAMATMLAFSRRFPELWLKEAPEIWNFQSTQCLSGQKLGLVGFGGIGQRIARRRSSRALCPGDERHGESLERSNAGSREAGTSSRQYCPGCAH